MVEAIVRDHRVVQVLGVETCKVCLSLVLRYIWISSIKWIDVEEVLTIFRGESRRDLDSLRYCSVRYLTCHSRAGKVHVGVVLRDGDVVLRISHWSHRGGR